MMKFIFILSIVFISCGEEDILNIYRFDCVQTLTSEPTSPEYPKINKYSFIVKLKSDEEADNYLNDINFTLVSKTGTYTLTDKRVAIKVKL